MALNILWDIVCLSCVMPFYLFTFLYICNFFIFIFFAFMLNLSLIYLSFIHCVQHFWSTVDFIVLNKLNLIGYLKHFAFTWKITIFPEKITFWKWWTCKAATQCQSSWHSAAESEHESWYEWGIICDSWNSTLSVYLRCTNRNWNAKNHSATAPSVVGGRYCPTTRLPCLHRVGHLQRGSEFQGLCHHRLHHILHGYHNSK